MRLSTKLIVFGSILLASLMSFPFLTQDRHNRNIKHYVESNLKEIMDNQEETLGIKHFGIPKITYEPPAHIDTNLERLMVSGAYDDKEDQIYLHSEVAITPEKNLANKLRKLLYFGEHDIKQTLEHELGHFYGDKLNENLHGSDWPNYSDKVQTEDIGEWIGKKLISEGIAEYFKRNMNDMEDDFKDHDWPLELDGFLRSKVIYSGGFHFVKPVIDNYGKKGIEYLITNPPNSKDLKDPQRYQRKVMEDLQRNSFFKNSPV